MPNGKLYWAGRDVFRANLDGSDSEGLGVGAAENLVLDSQRKQFYYTASNSFPNAETITRVNLDGTGAETIVSNLGDPRGLAIDPSQDRLYWSDELRSSLHSIKLDGSEADTLLNSPVLAPRNLAIDPTKGTLYWTTDINGIIQTANVDNRSSVLIDFQSLQTWGIALDRAAGKLYWQDAWAGSINRANLDGSAPEFLFRYPDGSSMAGLALDPKAGKAYCINLSKKLIFRANLDGTGIEDLVTTGIDRAYAIALDTLRGKMYWTDLGRGSIQRANFDGSQVEDLVTTGLSFPMGLAIDTESGKVYWTDTGTHKIQRANLDGSDVEDVITEGIVSPMGLVLLPPGGVNTQAADVAARTPSPALPYPNPFASETTVRFNLRAPGPISVKIYDVLGRERAVLTKGFRSAGDFEVRWDAMAFASGIYFCVLEAPHGVETIRLVVLK